MVPTDQIAPWRIAMRNSASVLLTAGGSVALLLCIFGFYPRAFAQTSALKGGEFRDYVLELNGPEGDRLELMLIIKPPNGKHPQRFVQRVDLPFRKEFEAQKYYVWVDGGKKGHNYQITLKPHRGPEVYNSETKASDCFYLAEFGDL